jgi:hypothetical protein
MMCADLHDKCLRVQTNLICRPGRCARGLVASQPIRDVLQKVLVVFLTGMSPSHINTCQFFTCQKSNKQCRQTVDGALAASKSIWMAEWHGVQPHPRASRGGCVCVMLRQRVEQRPLYRSPRHQWTENHQDCSVSMKRCSSHLSLTLTLTRPLTPLLMLGNTVFPFLSNFRGSPHYYPDTISLHVSTQWFFSVFFLRVFPPCFNSVPQSNSTLSTAFIFDPGRPTSHLALSCMCR